MEGNVTLQTQTTAAYQIVRWNSLVVLNVANTLPVSCHTHTHTHTHTYIYIYHYGDDAKDDNAWGLIQGIILWFLW